MADELTIRTTVDLSGLNALADTAERTMQRVVGAQLRVKAETKALKDAYSELGPAAAAGSAAATAGIAQHEAALVAATQALKNAKAAVDDLAGSEDRETASLSANISERQAATASISIAEGRMMGANRAAGAFLATTLGLGPIVQAAFPIIGAVALIEVLVRVGSAIKEATEALVGWDKEAKQAYANAEKANDRLIEQQVNLKIGATELGTVGKEGAAKAQAEVQKWTEQQKILQETIVTSGQALANVNTQIDELRERAKINPQKFLEQSTGIAGAALEAVHPAPKAPPESVPIASTDTIESLTKKQEELTQAVEKYRLKLLEIQQIHLPSAQALLPIADEKQAEQLGAAGLEARKRVNEARVALDEASTKHLFDIGQTTAAQEQASLSADAQRKLDIQIDYYQKLNDLIAKDPTKTAEVTQNKGQISALQVQKQTVEVEAQDKGTKAVYEAQIQSINAQVAAVKAGSQAKIDLIQKEVDLAKALFNGQGRDYEELVAKLNEADKEHEDKLSREYEQQIAQTTKLARDQERIAEDALKTQEVQLAAQDKMQEEQVQKATARREKTTGGLDLSVERDGLAQELALQKSNADAQTTLATQLADLKIAELQKVIDANNAAAAVDTVGAKKELAAAQDAAAQIESVQADLQLKLTQIKEAGLEKRQQLEQQETQAEQAEQDKILSFTTQISDQILFGSKSLGDSLAKVWQKVSDDAVGYIVKIAERWVVENEIMKAASALSSVLGLGNSGPASNPAGAPASAGGGIGSGASLGGAVFSQVSGNTEAAATAANTAAITANTAAITAQGAAGAAAKGAGAATTAATGAIGAVGSSPQAALAASFTALTPVVTSLTTAEVAQVTSLTSLNTALLALTPAISSFTAGLISATAAIVSDTAAEIAETIAVGADTIAETSQVPAIAADTAATIIHTATLGFDVGGYVPRTGMAVLHAGERVATPNMWDEIGRMGESRSDGQQGGDVHIHHHMGNVHALDGDGVGKVLVQRSHDVGRAMEKIIKRGHFNPRRLGR